MPALSSAAQLKERQDAEKKGRREGRADFERVEGYVWCDRHGCVHSDELNPFDHPDEADWCQQEEHRSLFIRKEVV